MMNRKRQLWTHSLAFAYSSRSAAVVLLDRAGALFSPEHHISDTHKPGAIIGEFEAASICGAARYRESADSIHATAPKANAG